MNYACDFSQSETEKYFQWITIYMYMYKHDWGFHRLSLAWHKDHLFFINASSYASLIFWLTIFFCIVTPVLCTFTRLQILRLLGCTQLCHETFWLLSAMRSSRPPWPGDHGSLNTALTGPFSRSTLNEVPNRLLRPSHLWVTTCTIR